MRRRQSRRHLRCQTPSLPHPLQAFGVTPPPHRSIVRAWNDSLARESGPMEPGWRQAIAVAVASNRPHVARKFLAGMQPTDQRTSMYVYPTPPGRDGSWLSEALWAVAAFAARNESTVAFAAPASTGDAPPATRTTSVTVCLLQSISEHLRPHAVESLALGVLRAAESPLSLS